MPLSEREQRILEEIEKNLSKEDPAFARDVRRRAPRMEQIRRVKWGALVFLVGLVALLGFFVSRVLIVGVAAFGAMVTGIVLVAGSLHGFAPMRRSGLRDPRQRLTQSFERWEQRLRERYKRR